MAGFVLIGNGLFMNWKKKIFHPNFIVLNGYTGTGKTEILKRLAANGYPVIDFEHIAGHRGSIFGQIGLEPSNQKKFDSLAASMN